PTSDIHTLSLHDALPIFAFPIWNRLCHLTPSLQATQRRIGYCLYGSSPSCDEVPSFLRVESLGGTTADVPDELRAMGVPGRRNADRKSTRLNSSHLGISY